MEKDIGAIEFYDCITQIFVRYHLIKMNGNALNRKRIATFYGTIWKNIIAKS